MIGRPRVHYRVTDSTNERAKDLALQGAPHGTTVTADEQTAGRQLLGARVRRVGDAVVHPRPADHRGVMRTSESGASWRVAAASPRLMAIDSARYESS